MNELSDRCARHSTNGRNRCIKHLLYQLLCYCNLNSFIWYISSTFCSLTKLRTFSSWVSASSYPWLKMHVESRKVFPFKKCLRCFWFMASELLILIVLCKGFQVCTNLSINFLREILNKTCFWTRFTVKRLNADGWLPIHRPFETTWCMTNIFQCSKTWNLPLEVKTT